MTTINQHWISENKKSHSVSEAFAKFALETGGARYVLDGVQRGMQLCCEVYSRHKPADPMPRSLQKADAHLGTATSVMGFAFLPAATLGAMHSCAALGKNDGVSEERKREYAVRDCADALATYGYCAQFLKETPVGRIAQLAEITYDVTELRLAKGDYTHAAMLEESATGEAKEVFAHTKTYNLLRIARAVVGIAAMALLLIGAVMGISLLPSLVLTTAFFAAALLNIVRDVYKHRGPYPILDFDHSVYHLG